VRKEENMNRKTVGRIILGSTLLFLGYVAGILSNNHSLAYNRPEYELIRFEAIRYAQTGDPQRRAKQVAKRLDEVEEKIDKMGYEGWELHSFWGNVAIFER
jgi:hypothetical protein